MLWGTAFHNFSISYVVCKCYLFCFTAGNLPDTSGRERPFLEPLKRQQTLCNFVIFSGTFSFKASYSLSFPFSAQASASFHFLSYPFFLVWWGPKSWRILIISLLVCPAFFLSLVTPLSGCPGNTFPGPSWLNFLLYAWLASVSPLKSSMNFLRSSF